MREIKFRAWDGRKMLSEDDFFVRHGCCHKIGMFDDCKKPDYPLMQYTGLKDRNGVEIYEGDVLGAWLPKQHEIIHDGERMFAYKNCFCSKPRVVEFIRGSFRLNNPISDSDNYYGVIDYSISTRSCDLEIIGNIYENPEPLEGE